MGQHGARSKIPNGARRDAKRDAGPARGEIPNGARQDAEPTRGGAGAKQDAGPARGEMPNRREARCRTGARRDAEPA
ncbi:hypothetical protein Shyhy02_23410 [Streptomyces hygroscopicus subsp. hygroscopicus]|nr:hypothetical protein Shyhy02_23410 [Streptomyces hygroscopicus subsp. hygroscopicus]